MKTHRPTERTAAQWPRLQNTVPGDSNGGNGSIRVLIADDNLQLLELLTNRLRGLEYEVESATDGEAAWECLRTGSFDLVITDNDMPRLKGVDLVRRMRAQSFTHPVILISGKMHWSDPDLFGLLAPGTALSKPFSISELLRKINELLPYVSQNETNG